MPLVLLYVVNFWFYNTSNISKNALVQKGELLNVLGQCFIEGGGLSQSKCVKIITKHKMQYIQWKVIKLFITFIIYYWITQTAN